MNIPKTVTLTLGVKNAIRITTILDRAKCECANCRKNQPAIREFESELAHNLTPQQMIQAISDVETDSLLNNAGIN